MEIHPGDTFLYSYPYGDKLHLNVVIQKIVDSDRVLCAFVSSIKEGKEYDNSCILNAGDISFIKHPSYVVYKDLFLMEIEDLKRMINTGSAIVKDHISDDVLERIREGAMNSKFTRTVFKKYLYVGCQCNRE